MEQPHLAGQPAPVDHWDVVWPRSPITAEVVDLAPRLERLDGATVAFLWDDMFRGDEIFPILERELTARYEGLRVVGYETFGSTHGEGEHEVVAALSHTLADHGVDAVISGMGC